MNKYDLLVYSESYMFARYGKTISDIEHAKNVFSSHSDFWDIDTTEVLSGINNKTLYFIFIGSQEAKDFLYNFDFFKEYNPYGLGEEIKVHNGYFNAFEKVRSMVEKKIKDPSLEGSFNRVVLAGQSYGAGVATLAALYITNFIKGLDITCITSGSCRIGNEAFVNTYKLSVKKSYRFVYGKDLYSFFPPRFLGYRHVGELIKFQPKKKKVWDKIKLLSFRDHMFKKTYYFAFKDAELTKYF